MPACRSYKLAIFAAIVAFPTIVRACLRATLDERAIQWSTAIVEAELKSIDPVVEEGDSNKHATQLCFFAVKTSIGGPLKDGDIFTVTRAFSNDAPPLRCAVTLKDKRQGEKFILLLRRSTNKRDMTIVHMASRADFDDGMIADLQARIADVRRAEAAGTDEAIAAQVAALASAQDVVEADEAEKALLGFGPRAIEALTRKLDDPALTDAGRTRAKRVIGELTPPPQPSEPRD